MDLPEPGSDDRHSPIHRTQELAARLRSAIKAGSYEPGQLIPSERELSVSEGVSRTTVRRAIQLLVNAGVLHRMPGSGTYVGRSPAAESQQVHGTIGMIVPSLANPYFGELATAIEREANRSGFQLLLGQADLAGNNVAPYLERYAENPAVLGVIGASASDKLSSAYRQFVASGKPLAFVVRHADVTGSDSVATDHVGGASELMRYLIALGHRRIAFIGGAEVRAMRHYQGYLEGLREAGIPADPDLLVEIDGEGDQIGIEGVGVLLGRRATFTAIFAQIDLVAIGVLRALRAAGLRVPQDVSLVGFDNIPSSEHLDPPLTTVDHSVHEIGRLAVLLLQDRITDRYDGPARRVIIQPQIILRASCGLVPPLTPSPTPLTPSPTPLTPSPTPLTPSPSPTRGEGSRIMEEKDRWEVPHDLRRRMLEVAREFRKEPTPSEQILWEALRNRKLDGRKFRRQQPLGPFVVDFFCPEERLIVEVDGPIHETQCEPDRLRQELIEALGMRFVRVAAADVERSLAAVITAIRAALPPSPPVGEGAGG